LWAKFLTGENSKCGGRLGSSINSDSRSSLPQRLALEHRAGVSRRSRSWVEPRHHCIFMQIAQIKPAARAPESAHAPGDGFPMSDDAAKRGPMATHTNPAPATDEQVPCWSDTNARYRGAHSVPGRRLRPQAETEWSRINFRSAPNRAPRCPALRHRHGSANGVRACEPRLASATGVPLF
jgi:hypothetical protein